MNIISSKITILCVGKPYDITLDDGTHQSGCSIHYLMSDGFPQAAILEDDGLLGVQPVKASMPTEFYAEAKTCGVPCVADCDFIMRISNNKPVIKPYRIKLPNLASSYEVSPETQAKIDAIEEKYGNPKSSEKKETE